MCRRWSWGWRQEEEKTVKYRRGWNWTLTFLEWQISCPTSSWESQSSWKSPQSHWIPPWLISLAPGGSWGPQVSPSFASGTWYLEAQRMGVRRGKPLSLFPRTSSLPFPILFWWRRKWQPTPVFLHEEFHGQWSLAGCSPWDHKESDTT